MDTARCYKCGFTMKGVFRKGPPKACPACGFTRSNEVVARIKAEKVDRMLYAQKGPLGKLVHSVKKMLKGKQEPIV